MQAFIPQVVYSSGTLARLVLDTPDDFIISPLEYGHEAHIELLFLRDRMFPFESLGTEEQTGLPTLGAWSIRPEWTPTRPTDSNPAVIRAQYIDGFVDRR